MTLLARGQREPRMLALTAALGAIWVGFAIATDGVFTSPRNLYNLAVQSSVVGVMACGMVLVITARHIDLAVGSVLGFTGMLVAVAQTEWLSVEAAASWPLATALGLGVGALVGAWQGWWVAYRGVPAFVVTLGGLLVFRGAAYLVTDGRTVAPLAVGFERLGGGLSGSIGAPASFSVAAVVLAVVALQTVRRRRERAQHGIASEPAWRDVAVLVVSAVCVLGFVAVMNAHEQPVTGEPRGIPVPVLVWIATAIGMSALFRRTRFGRYVSAIGGNPEAAALAGIDVRRVTLGVFAWMGALAALGGVITTARLGAGANSMGTLAELSVIAAAVIGGTSLAGGRGSIPGAVVGALIMQSLENGMLLLGVSSAARQIAIGLVLIAAVWLDASTHARVGKA